MQVQTILLKDGEQVGPDTFNKDVQKDALKEARLRVVLEGPAAPPSPVPEASEQGDDESRSERAEPMPAPASRSAATAYSDVAAISKEASALQTQLSKVTKERDDLRRMLDQVQLHGAATSKSNGESKARLSIIHLILVAVLAFLIGHFTHPTA